jgi:hypothetical protein
MNTNLHEKSTLYLADLWGYDRIEASDVTWRFEKYAQFPKAARVEYTVRGKRKRQTAMITTVPLVVLDGWGHPQPPPKFGPPERVAGQTTAQTTRRLSCDPEWQNEFDAFLHGYLEGSKTRVLLDLRKHEPRTA